MEDFPEELKKKTFIITSLLLAALSWVMHTIYALLVTSKVDFFGALLFDVSTQELLVRATIAILFLLFGLFTQRLYDQHSASVEDSTESSNILSMLLETTKDIVVVQDCNGKILYYNASPEMGFFQDEVIGKDMAEFHSNGGVMSKVREKMQQVIQKGQPASFIDEIRWGEKEIVLDARLFPAKDKNGQTTSITTIMRNITEYKLAERDLKESEETFRTLAEQSPNMIFINKGGKIVYANKACEKKMGYTKGELYSLEFNFMDLIAPKSKELIKRYYSEHMQGAELPPIEYTLVNKAGEEIEALYESQLITYQGENAILGTVIDITERKKNEDIVVKRLRLERAVVEIAASLITSTRVEKAVNQGLGFIGELYEADRIMLFRPREDEGDEVWDSAFEWHQPGIRNRKDKLKNLSMLEFSWWESIIKKNAWFTSKNINEMPIIARHAFEKLQLSDVKSFLIIPLRYENRLSGVLSLSTVEHSKEWIAEDVELLSLLGEVTVTCLEKDRIQKELQKATGQVKKKTTSKKLNILKMPADQ